VRESAESALPLLRKKRGSSAVSGGVDALKKTAIQNTLRSPSKSKKITVRSCSGIIISSLRIRGEGRSRTQRRGRKVDALPVRGLQIF